MITVHQSTFYLSAVYNRSPDTDFMRQTREDLLKILGSIKDWSDIRLEKELQANVRAYDPHAVRVYVEDHHIANIPFPNSPVVNLLIDFANDEVIVLQSIVNWVPHEDESLDLRITIRVLTPDENVYKALSDLEFTQVDMFLNPVPKEEGLV